MSGVEWSILLPAMLAGLLVLLSHVPFGMSVLQRGVIFADLAVAQIAGLGVIVSAIFDVTGWWIQLLAAVCALLGAALLAAIEQKLPHIKEACIGLVFVLAASGGVLLLSGDVHAAEHIKDLLVGQILWVSAEQLWVTAGLTAVLLLAWRYIPLLRGDFGFYALFALAVTASVQLVGVYLVFASLIVPALATSQIATRRLLWAFVIGIAGYLLGLPFSAWLDLPSGAVVVWSMTLIGAICFIFTAIVQKKHAS